MKREYQILINQLNSLIGFLDVASKDVFEVIKDHKAFDDEYISSIGEIYSNDYSIYQNQITRSAILLGYAHFEAFLTELMKRRLIQKPTLMIPNGKKAKDKSISYLDFIQSKSKDDLIYKLAEKEVRNVLYRSSSELIKFCEEKLGLNWTAESKIEMPIVNGVRNCLMHNNGLVDTKLASISDYKIGDEISFSANEVHRFGVMVRSLIFNLLNQYEAYENISHIKTDDI